MPKKTSSHEPRHSDNTKELSRLNRVAGQVEGVKRMIEQQRYSPDILTQLRAIRSAVNSIEANILETHLNACVFDACDASDTKETNKKISEVTELYRRFND